MLDSIFEEGFEAAVGRITSELTALLAQHPGQADTVLKLGEAVRLGASNVDDLYCSLEMWGGSGSVADVSLQEPALDEEHCRLLADLVECFERAGYRYERASSWAAVFRRWLRDGVFWPKP